MSEYSDIIKLALQQRFKSPCGVRENEPSIYANIAHPPLYLDNVDQIEVLQISEAIENDAKYKSSDQND